MGKRRILFLILLLFLAIQTQAQWEAPFSQFWTAKSYYNPSFAGETDKVQISGVYKYLWAEVTDAPKHIFLSADMPIEFLGMKHGVGIQTYSNAIGNERNSLFAIQYTSKQKVGRGVLNIGIQVGMNKLNFDAGYVRLAIDSTQNNRKTIKTNPTDKKTIDINAGISWTSKNFHIGVAAMHINQPTFFTMNTLSDSGNAINDSTFSKIPISYNFMSGCNITLFYPLEIQPALFVQTNFSDTRLQTVLRGVYNKKYSAGASWNGKEGYSFFAGVIVQEIEIGYAYDLYRSGIGKESSGSHEVSVRYRFPIDLFKRKPMPHKSIRLL